MDLTLISYEGRDGSNESPWYTVLYLFLQCWKNKADHSGASVELLFITKNKTL